MKNIVRFVALAVIMAVSASILTPAAAAPGGNGGGNGGGDNVCQPQSDHVDPGDGVKTVTVEAPAHKVITGYCVKAGSANQGNGPEYVNGLNATEVTFSHSSGKDISHYVVFYDDIPFNHNWEYADPTCTSLFVDYPDNLPNPQNANHVNIRFNFDGKTITFNWHTAGTWAPEQTFVYADHPNWGAIILGVSDWTSYTVEWVQVAESNYHWQGELECGDDPEPTPATGSLTIECVVDTTYKGTVSVTAGDEVAQDGKFHWKVAPVGEGRLFDGRLDPFQTFNAERELELTPGATVILAQKPIVTGTEVVLAEAVVPPACPVPVWEGQILDLAVECDSNVTFTVANSGNQDFQYRYYIDNDLQGSANVPAGGSLDVVIPAGDLEAGDTVTVILLGYNGHVVTPAEQVVYPEPCFVADPGAELTYATECDAGISFSWTNTGNVALTAKLYRDDILLMSPEIPAGAGGGWALNHGAQISEAGQTARVELYYEDVLISTTGNVEYAGPCFVPAPAGTVQLGTECDAPIEGSVINTGNVDLTFIVTTDGMSTERLDLLVGETRSIGMATPVEGSTVKVELFDGDTLIDSAEIVHPGECPQPEGDLAIECVVNTDYRITGSVTAADKVAPDGRFYAYVAVDGISDDRLFTVGTAPFETKEFARTRTLTPGATLVLSQGPWVEGGIQTIASVTVPESCPVAPSGDLSIECVVDDLYDVDAFIDGGSTGVNWLLRIRGGGGIVTQGFVPAFEAETVTLTEAQFDEGLVLVLRAPANGGKLDSVSVPAPCFAPVSDSSITLDTGCDSDVDATVTNYGETTLYANVYINDVLYFNVDSVIEPGQVAEFNIPALALEPGDEVKVTVWGPEDYERESIIEYPEACPTTTTVPPTTVPPTTVPPTTTVPVPECLGPGDEDPRPQPGPGEPALPAIPQCETPDYTG